MSTTGKPGIVDRNIPTPSDKHGFLPGPPTRPSLSVALPPELWLEIIGHVKDIATLSMLARVNCALHDIAERDLYHTITLERDSVILRFCTSVSVSLHHATLVTRLHLPNVGGQVLHGHSSRLFLSTLTSLHNLEYLTLRLFDGLERSGIVSAKVFQDMVSMRFPLLRGFSTNLSVYILPIGSTFFREHPLLEDLDIRLSPVSHARTDGLAHFQLGSLRSIACGAWFLHDRFVFPPTLTHYHARDMDLEPGALPRIGRLLGQQLVSLRVSERFAYHQEQPAGRHAVMLDELVTLFPRLRFLQLDMHFVADPYINKHIVNCTAECSSSGASNVRRPRRPRRETRLTLAWACDRRPWTSRVNTDLAPSEWNGFLKSTALEVLHSWDDYVERIVYRHTVAPWMWMSVSLSEEGPWPICKENIQMKDEQWKLI
ncbi:hypothetical protein LXA43DRAFT_329883 [Ganoderma leucocontextum]|nr:hypothetical protein LXA43DRAFT_329883 [Ganoderma leucocontextum]